MALRRRTGTMGGIVVFAATVIALGGLAGASATAGVDDSQRAIELEAAAVSGESAGAVGGDVGVQSNHGCADGNSCMWYYTQFTGLKAIAEGWMDEYGWLYYEDYTFQSAKNRFANRRFRVKSALTGITRCLDPGEDRPELPVVMSLFNVGSLGSRCS